MIERGLIRSFTEHHSSKHVCFLVKFRVNDLDKIVSSHGGLMQFFGLHRQMALSNMHAFNSNGTIQKFENPEDIIKQWYEFRLEKYKIRKEYIISKLTNELDLLKYKAQFIEYVLEDKIVVFKQQRDMIIQKIEEYKFPKLAIGKEEKSYDYITNLSLFSLTQEKIDELKKKLEDKEEELANVQDTNEIIMWKSELNEFKDVYKKWYKKRNKKFLSDMQSLSCLPIETTCLHR